MSELRVNNVIAEGGTSAPNLAYGAQVPVGAAITGAGGINVTGIITGTSFSGDGSSLTGIADTGRIDSASVTSSGIVTISNTTASTSTSTGALIVSGGVGIAGSLHVGENVSVGGTLTYEDVTNIDSVGIVTAQTGVRVTAGGLVVTAGVSTLAADLSIADTIVHTGDTNTKIRFPAADTITAETSGVERLRIDSGGAIGIGTVDPQPTTGLDVWGGIFVTSQDGGNSSGIWFSDPDNKSDYFQLYMGSTSNDLRLKTAGGSWKDSVVVLNTGEVGISSEVPTSTLDVRGGVSVGSGVIAENLYTVASALTGTVNFDVVTNGLVQYHTTNSSGTFIVNLRGDGSTTLNSLLRIGQTTVFTLYSAQNNASYYMTDFKIDGSSQTEKWNGGTAPSAGTASGVDVYTFNIMKTANATFTVFATFSNFA